MKSILIRSLSVFLLGSFASAQQITPVWYQHINGSSGVADANKLPILVNKTSDAERADGDSGLDAYTGLFKYDDARLILGVRENGIQEASASAEELAIAAQYPDRSLIWIEAATGKPLGLAWSEAIFPADALGYDVTLPEKGNQGAKTQFFWRFGIQDGPEGQRALYTTYKHLILRYAAKTGGGWETTPTIAYEEPLYGIKTLANGQPGDEGTGSSAVAGDPGSWRSWRFRDFGVYGSGNDTVLLAGGGTWRVGMHPQMLVTTDGGLTFRPKGRVNDRDGGSRTGFSLGGLSSPVVKYGKDSAHPNLLTIYHGHFPGTGWPARPDRYLVDPDTATPVPALQGAFLIQPDAAPSGSLPSFVWEAAGKDGLPIDHAVDGVDRYDGNWNGTLAAHKDVDYIVSYAIPSWNNQFGGIYKPGWLGVHTLNGEISTGDRSSFKLEFTEQDEIPASSWQYDPWIQLVPDATAPKNQGKATAYVTFGNAGFGVFSIQNVAPTLVEDVADTEVIAGENVTLKSNSDGGPNSYRWFKNGVALSEGKYTQGADRSLLTLKSTVSSDAGRYRVEVTNPLGNVTSRSAKLTVKGAYLRPPTSLTAASGVTAKASSTAEGGAVTRLIDQNTDGNWGAGSVYHSAQELNPWAEIDLGTNQTITRLVYWRRTDCCPNRSLNLIITVRNTAGAEVFRSQSDGAPENPWILPVDPPVAGQVIRVERILETLDGDSYLNIAEVQAFGNEPPRLAYGTDDTGLALVWDTEGTVTLESADKVEGPYATVAGATSPYSSPTTGAAKFYRVRR